LPKYLWAEAFCHSVWLQNRAPSRALLANITPHKKATGERPHLANLIEWGSKVWVKVLDVGKLEPRAVECHFMGYDEESKGYRTYLLEYLGQVRHKSGHLIAADYLEEIICISFLYLTSPYYVPLFPLFYLFISLLYW